MNRNLILLILLGSFLFLVLMIAAAGVIGIAVLRSRPLDDLIKLPRREVADFDSKHQLTITLRPDGIRLEGQLVSLENLVAALEKKRKDLAPDVRRKDWKVNILSNSTATDEVKQIIRVCNRAGFDRFELRAVPEAGETSTMPDNAVQPSP